MNPGTFTRGGGSNRPDVEPSDPHLDLLKTRFEAFLQFHKKQPVLLRPRDIDEYLNQLVAIDESRMLPLAFENLRFVGRGTESHAELMDHIAVKFLGNQRAIVKPQRQINLVSA